MLTVLQLLVHRVLLGDLSVSATQPWPLMSVHLELPVPDA